MSFEGRLCYTGSPCLKCNQTKDSMQQVFRVAIHFHLPIPMHCYHSRVLLPSTCVLLPFPGLRCYHSRVLLPFTCMLLPFMRIVTLRQTGTSPIGVGHFTHWSLVFCFHSCCQLSSLVVCLLVIMSKTV